MYASLPELTQNYAAYTDEDRLVWNTLYDRQMEHLEHFACREYLDAQKTIGFESTVIPNVEQLNALLREASGFSLRVVPNIMPNEIFMPCLANKEFTATTWLRGMAELDYISEPDMFHDVFGHVPLLAHPVFADFFHRFGVLGQRYLQMPKAIEMLGRVYWFTVEFGLIQQDGHIKIFGAGLISSYAESKHCFSSQVVHKPFNIRTIMQTDFDNSLMQNLYFVLPSFQALLSSLEEIEEVLEIELR